MRPSHSANRGSAAFALIGAAISLSVFTSLAVPAQGATPSPADKAKLEELKSVSAELNKYDMETMVDPKYIKGMAPTFTPMLRKKVDILSDLEKTAGPQADSYRYQRMVDLALLSHFGDATANSEIEEVANAKTAATATVGKLGLCLRDWWTKTSAEDQEKVIDRLRAIAKADPTNDHTCAALLAVAADGAATRELAEEARQIVEKDLKGKTALHYKAMPNKVGRPLTIAGVTPDGKSFTTAGWKGKVIVVDFWATWCPPCREEIPNVVKTYEENHAKGLEIVGVSCDSQKPELKSFLADHKDMAWPQLFAPVPPSGWHALAAKFGIDSIPRVYVIDRNGILRSVTARGRLDKILPDLLAETPK